MKLLTSLTSKLGTVLKYSAFLLALIKALETFHDEVKKIDLPTNTDTDNDK